MSAPVAFNQQPTEPIVGWFGFGLAAATVAAFFVIAGMSLWYKKVSRARSYRTATLMVLGVGPTLAVAGARASGYLTQTTTVWETDPAVYLQAAWWDFLAAGWGIIFCGMALVSYVPQSDLFAIYNYAKQKITGKGKKNSGKNSGTNIMDEEGNPITVTVTEPEVEYNKPTMNLDTNSMAWTSPAANLLAAVLVLVYGPIVLQQAFPRALWQWVGVGVFGLICEICTFIIIGSLISAGAKMAHDNYKAGNKAKKEGKGNKNQDSTLAKKVVREAKEARNRYRILLYTISFYAFFAIVGMVVAAGMSPVLATFQLNFTVTNAIAVAYTSQFACGVIVLVVTSVLDMKRSNLMSEEEVDAAKQN